MFFLSLLHHYFLWHYTRAFYEIWHVWRNLLWFTIHFFSLPQLITSWFSPFKRLTETRGKPFDLEDLAGFIIINTISRLIGAFIRTFFILLGILSFIGILVGGVLTYFFWVVAPVGIISLILTGIGLLIPLL
jgi:hypothetical protein